MGCGASTNVKERLDYITQLEAEVQDLKAQRGSLGSALLPPRSARAAQTLVQP